MNHDTIHSYTVSASCAHTSHQQHNKSTFLYREVDWDVT